MVSADLGLDGINLREHRGGGMVSADPELELIHRGGFSNLEENFLSVHGKFLDVVPAKMRVKQS